ncbi:MAG: FkbM family methyltransferase [Bacteroidales bacterium]
MGLYKDTIGRLTLWVNNKNYRSYTYFKLFLLNRKIKQGKIIKTGRFHIAIVDTNSFIFQYKEIFVEQIYKFSTSNPNPVIFDCGGNIGLSILYFKQLFPEAKILGFEADPQIANILSKNIELNHLKNVTLIPKAVWIDNQGVNFNADGKDGGAISKTVKSVHIDSIRLKDCLQKKSKIDFLKMDIEGAEFEVLNDCREELHKVDKIFVEYHSLAGQDQKLNELLAILKETGFKYNIQSINFYNNTYQKFAFENGFDMQLNIFGYKA